MAYQCVEGILKSCRAQGKRFFEAVRFWPGRLMRKRPGQPAAWWEARGRQWRSTGKKETPSAEII